MVKTIRYESEVFRVQTSTNSVSNPWWAFQQKFPDLIKSKIINGNQTNTKFSLLSMHLRATNFQHLKPAYEAPRAIVTAAISSSV